MALIVEDGSIVENANTYIDIAYLDAYWTALGNADAVTSLTKEVNILQAMQYIENYYGQRYQGSKVDADQSLLWPRSGVTLEGFALDEDVIPERLKKAVSEATEKARLGLLPSDIQAANMYVTRKKVGPIEIEYGGSGGAVYNPNNVFQMIDWLMGPLLRYGPNELRIVRS